MGLAAAEKMQERLRPAEVILLGSRAAGDHRPDSDVDLMAVCADEAAVREADETLRQLLEGKYDVPVVNVVTITRGEFVRTAPLGQSFAGRPYGTGNSPRQTAGLPAGTGAHTGGDPEATVFWLYLAETHLKSFDIIINSEHEHLRRSHIPAFQGQTALERAFKGLLAAGNDGTRFRRDAEPHVAAHQGHRPHHGRERRGGGGEPAGRDQGTGRERVQPDQVHGGLAAGGVVPDPTEAEWQAMTLYLAPAIGALVTEALDRSGATREELQQERDRRREGAWPVNCRGTAALRVGGGPRN